MDNVQMYKVGQKQTYHAALRFDGAQTNTHSVTNSAIYDGEGWGLSVTASAKVTIKDTQVIGFKNIGISIHASDTVTLDNVITGDVKARSLYVIGKAADLWGCVAICSYFEPDTKCKDIVVKNSTSIGCKFAGFIAEGHSCTAANTNFFGNVARSIDGHGARIYPSANPARVHTSCYAGSKFAAAWCKEQAVVTADKSLEFRLSDV
jgi:hypothetical protein